MAILVQKRVTTLEKIVSELTVTITALISRIDELEKTVSKKKQKQIEEINVEKE